MLNQRNIRQIVDAASPDALISLRAINSQYKKAADAKILQIVLDAFRSDVNAEFHAAKIREYAPMILIHLVAKNPGEKIRAISKQTADFFRVEIVGDRYAFFHVKGTLGVYGYTGNPRIKFE